MTKPRTRLRCVVPPVLRWKQIERSCVRLCPELMLGWVETLQKTHQKFPKLTPASSLGPSILIVCLSRSQPWGSEIFTHWLQKAHLMDLEWVGVKSTNQICWLTCVLNKLNMQGKGALLEIKTKQKMFQKTPAFRVTFRKLFWCPSKPFVAWKWETPFTMVQNSKNSLISWLFFKQVEEWFNEGLESSDIGAKWTFQLFFCCWLCETMSVWTHWPKWFNLPAAFWWFDGLYCSTFQAGQYQARQMASRHPG